MVSNGSNVEQCLMRLIDLKNITNVEAELNFLVMLWGPAQLELAHAGAYFPGKF